MSALGKIAGWFWAGVAGVVAGGLVVLAGIWANAASADWIFIGSLVTLAGWSAMLVGVIGKGVQLGVRAANDD